MQGKMACHDQIKVMIVGTFDFFIWTDAEFQCDSHGDIHFAIHALVLAQFAFYF